MMNTPINKRSLADEVADQLRSQIIAGMYKVGEQLPTEPDLMKAFSVAFFHSRGYPYPGKLGSVKSSAGRRYVY